MAKFNVVGLDDVQEAMLRQDAIVEEAVPEMLKAGGAVMRRHSKKRSRQGSTADEARGRFLRPSKYPP